MKNLISLALLFLCVVTNAQNPLIVKTVSSTVTEPEYNDQKYWQNNEWNGLFFYQGKGTPSKLCVTDGTNAGTQYVADIGNGQLITTIPAQDFMYLITNYVISISPAITETQLWKSDGTAAGTVLLYTFPQITGSTVGHNWTSNRRNQNFSLIGNVMIFSAYDAANGVEIWKTDGTAAGTALLKDIKAGTGGSTPWGYCKIGSEVFFSAMQTGFERKLWKTDGTTAGTVQVAVPEPFYIVDYAIGVLNNKMLFYAHNTVDGYEPYISDGTPAGTYMLKNVNPTATSSGNSSLAAVQCTEWHFNNNHCYFIAFNGTANALWRTDGTNAGTIQLTTNADNVSSANSNTTLTDIDSNNLWMLHHSTSGNSKLYKTDGTAAGTYLVKQGLNLPANMKLYKNSCWFSGRPSGSFANLEPWRSGGNAATTNMALDIAPGFPLGAPTLLYSSTPYGFFVKNNKLYFFASTSIPSAHHLYQYTGDFTFNGLSNNNWHDSANWAGRMPPGITDTVFIADNKFPVVNGQTAYAGVLNVPWTSGVNLLNATDSLIINKRLNAEENPSIGGAGVVAFSNIQGDTAFIGNRFVSGNLAIMSHTKIDPALPYNGTNMSVSGQLNIVNNSQFFIGNQQLLLPFTSSTITTSGNSYINTNGVGMLRINNVGATGKSGNVLFPVGNGNNYTPVIIKNWGPNTTVSVKSQPRISSYYSNQTQSGNEYINNAAVDNTWYVDAAPTSNIDLTLQWNPSQELPGFNPALAYLGHWIYPAGWNLGTVATVNGTNPFTITRTGIISFSPFGILNNNVTLPLDFLSFSAQKCNRSNVCLNWKTVNEQNVSHFEVERSSDGVNYSVIGTVQAGGNSYNYEDRQPNWSSKNLYYRIKQVDIDNRSKRSTVAWLKGDNADVQVYPTLVDNSFTVQNNTAQTMWLQVTDATGKMVLQQRLVTGTNLVSADRLAKGVYFYAVKNTEGETATGRIVKQ